MHCRDLAQTDRMQRDPMKLQAVMPLGDVGEPAPEPVERLADHDIEQAGLGIGAQLLDAVTEGAAAADRPVGIDLGQFPGMALDIPAADLHLILDGSLFLVLRAVAGIDDGGHGVNLPLGHGGVADRRKGPRRRRIWA